MEKRRYSGRYFLSLGAVALAIWAGYECWVRIDTIWWALKGVMDLCRAEGVPLARALGYFDVQMFYLTGFLLGCVIFSLITLLLRNRPLAGYAMLGLDGGLLWLGASLGLFGMDITSWMQSLKLFPLVLIGAGCIINLFHFYAARRRKKKKLPAPRSQRTYNRYPSTNREMARLVRERRKEG